MFGLIAPVAGWLMDRLEARVVMSTGAVLTVIGMVGASQTHSFWPMLGGICADRRRVAGTTIVPCSVVAADWFADNRGLAISVTSAGAAVVGVVISVFAQYMIGRQWSEYAITFIQRPEPFADAASIVAEEAGRHAFTFPHTLRMYQKRSSGKPHKRQIPWRLLRRAPSGR